MNLPVLISQRQGRAGRHELEREAMGNSNYGSLVQLYLFPGVTMFEALSHLQVAILTYRVLRRLRLIPVLKEGDPLTDALQEVVESQLTAQS